ncbi:hypothetical protein MNBD_GAMMA09-217 [hydrothermal vent metagenome]|uniref:BioF2-like acetyltransferase domain-containing protein n=1 Tax=hydrothermal vent metagenome TaxID=652676 RepID=A0A3B0XMF6_9ZZZZ
MQADFHWQLITERPRQALIDEWQQLSENNPDSCSSSFPIFSINSEIFLKGRKIFYAFAYKNEKMVCVIPFFIKSKIVNHLKINILQTINHDHIDTYVIAGQNLWDINELIQSFLSFLQYNLKGWDYFHAHNLICEARVSQYNQIPLYDKKLAYFEVSNNTSAAGIISKKLLKNVTRLQNKIASNKGPLNLRCSVDEADFKSDLKVFIELEGSGWKSREKTSINCNSDVEDFYKQTWAAFSAQGKSQIYILYAGDVPIAGSLSFRHGRKVFLHKIAYLDSLSRYGAGSVLVKLIIESALTQAGVDIICFNTYSDWVQRWHPLIYRLNSIEYFNNTPKGLLLNMAFGLYRSASRLYKYLQQKPV